MGAREAAACGPGGRAAGQEARATAPAEAPRRAVPSGGCGARHGPAAVSERNKAK